jgi:hypothetical protein
MTRQRSSVGFSPIWAGIVCQTIVRWVCCALVVAAVITIASTSRGAELAQATGPREKTVVRRFALITGASQGGTDRVPLRYASSDARALRHVLSDLGGLAEAETVLLLDVNRARMREGFDKVKQMIAAVHAPDSRTEVIFYYSGHSDEQGLLLGSDRVTYTELKAWVEETRADVRIAVLDSCASGALTRSKGGVHRPPFLVDTSSTARGHAYLTASAENEAAQESDRIGAAYFTHYLVSGLRGAADVSHDGRVTLSEAYQYAFTETLARTETTRGGPQHASYDFQLAGKGDLVMTDLRATTASLVLPPEMAGRVFVRDADGQLVAEVHKLAAQPILLGLPAGRYRVTLDEARRLSETTVNLAVGQQSTLDPERLVAIASLPTVRRGPGEVDGPAIEGQATPPPVQPVNVSLFFGMVDGSPPTENNFVLGFGARSARLRGLSLTLAQSVDGDASGMELGYFGSLNRGKLKGFQLAGLANLTLGSVDGLQLSGIVNSAGDNLRGAQVAGVVNLVRDNFVGPQIAGVINATGGGGRGVQLAGVANAARGDVRGVQLSGAVNVAGGDLRGLQLTGTVNLARQLEGLQLAVLNIAGDVTGTQLGLVNIARNVRGAQVGLVNVAGDVHGASFGLVTFVKNGIHEVELSSNEVGATMISGLLGTRRVYTRLGLGVMGAPGDLPGGRSVPGGAPADSPQQLLQWGMGGRFSFGERWFGEAELFGTQFWRAKSGALSEFRVGAESRQQNAVVGSVRLLAGVRLTSLVSVVFGPSYNVSTGWSGTDLVTGSGVGESVIHSGATTVRMYPGLTLGLRV